MKTFKTIIVLMSLVSILNCSNDGENESSREYITTCYKFVEEGSNLPISGQSVLIHYGYSNILSSQGSTDDDGVWCFEHWNDNGPSAVLYQPWLEDGYFNIPETLPLNGSINTIELIPKSYIRVHVVNVEPSSDNDRIDVSTGFFIDIEGKPKFGYRTTVPFEGKDIDVYYYYPAIKGLNYIEWKVQESGVLISSHTDEVSIEQYHDVIDYLIEY